MRRRTGRGRGTRGATAWWDDLGVWARFSIAGLAVAGLLAIGLGWYIPEWVGDRFLQTQAHADQTVLTALTETEALVVEGSSSDFTELDAFVDSALLRGDFVRVKLWAPDGTILYSDTPELVGRRFVPDEDFSTLTEPSSHVSDLSAGENEIEREEFESGLLETYVPVRSSDGELVAVWEVYHSLDEHDAAVTATRRTVRLVVGGGLALLALFLVSVFGGLTASVQHRRREAEHRSAELTTLLGIAQSTASSLDRQELVSEVVRHLDDSSAFEWVEATHTEDDRTVVLATTRRGGDPHGVGSEGRVVDASTPTTTGSLRVTALVAANGHSNGNEALLRAAVDELGVSIHRAQLYHDLESSRARLRFVMQQLVSAQEGERKRIVGDIHDGLGQDLHRVLFGIRGCLAADPSEVEAELHKLEDLVSASSGKLRRLLQELHPSTLDDIGLAASIRSLAERLRSEYGLKVDLRQNSFPEPPNPIRIAVFRIAQEALTNVAKHSGARAAKVTLSVGDEHIELKVCDDGTGIAGDRSDGLGLWLMRERAEALGGMFEIDGSHGTTVVARIPLEEVGVG